MSKKQRAVPEPAIPAIIELPIWQEAKKYLTPQRNPTKVRAHFNFRRSLPEELEERLLKVRIPCPTCGLEICPFRRHRNSKVLSMHLTGFRDNGHRPCSYTSYVRALTVAVQISINQGSETARVKRAIEDSKQPFFQIKDGVLILPPDAKNGKKNGSWNGH